MDNGHWAYGWHLEPMQQVSDDPTATVCRCVLLLARIGRQNLPEVFVLPVAGKVPKAAAQLTSQEIRRSFGPRQRLPAFDRPAGYAFAALLSPMLRER